MEWAPLENARRYEFEGWELPTGDCQYDWPEVTLPQGELRELRVVGVQVDGCRLIVEEGTPRGVPGPPKGKGYRSDTLEATIDKATARVDAAAIDASGGEVSALAASGRTWGMHAVTWYDPIGIAVTYVRANITWSWNGACASAPSSTANYSWFGPSGWSRESHSVTLTSAASCAWQLTDARAVYRNGIFCAGQTTWAYYDYVQVRGWSNGTISVLRSSRVAGGCTWLLNMQAYWGSQPA